MLILGFVKIPRAAVLMEEPYQKPLKTAPKHHQLAKLGWERSYSGAVGGAGRPKFANFHLLY